ncbi:hypothetical protein NFI96_002615 [Prochilodus magdalenae]|nr:hypothetical protein NFI96_002615 [Prochilodus magdalenae]
MIANMYCNILQQSIIPSLHDNDLKHTTKTTTALLKKLRVKVLDWPGMSPDLNPTEQLWGILKRKVEELKGKRNNTYGAFMLCFNHSRILPKQKHGCLLYPKLGRFLDLGEINIQLLLHQRIVQPLNDKLMKMEVDMHLVTWITDYLTGRPQHVRTRDCSSDTVISSTGAPQGTVLSPVLFTLYTSDFKYNSELCHMQKFSDDTAIVGCVRNGQEREYRSLVEDFVEWCTTNHLKLNITKTKEMCIDFRRSRPSQQPISIKGGDVEVVRSYRYLGVHLDERLDWSVNTDMVYKKAQSRLYFLRRLGSFRICQKLLLMFYQSVVASVLFYAVVCWGGSISKRDAGRLDRLVRKAGSVLGLELESLTPLAERRALSKLLHIMDNVHHPLHSTIIRQRSSFSDF